MVCAYDEWAFFNLTHSKKRATRVCIGRSKMASCHFNEELGVMRIMDEKTPHFFHKIRKISAKNYPKEFFS